MSAKGRRDLTLGEERIDLQDFLSNRMPRFNPAKQRPARY